MIIGKLKYSKRAKNAYDKSLIILNDVKVNNISKNIIENYNIPVDLVFHYDESGENHFLKLANLTSKKKII